MPWKLFPCPLPPQKGLVAWAILVAQAAAVLAVIWDAMMAQVQLDTAEEEEEERTLCWAAEAWGKEAVVPRAALHGRGWPLCKG